jgi:glycosidase
MKSVLLVLLLMMLTTITAFAGDPDPRLMNSADFARREELRSRALDWRNGAIVYQIIVDRFAPSSRLKAKKNLYKNPRLLRDWSETPASGHYNQDARVWSHELDFWGGDLESLMSRSKYLIDLGVDVVYLNPVFLSLTNHKYDAWDFQKIDPVYGTRKDLGRLADVLHQNGMKLVLDGVFNHMGRGSPMFEDARKNPRSRFRDFFRFTGKPERGYISWLDVENLPELNLEHPRVQDYIFRTPESVIQSYIRQEGVDGWRLDVAFDLGFSLLNEITRAAHHAKPGSVVIGEIWNYPEEWHPSVDGVMNMHGRKIILQMVRGKLSPTTAGHMWETLITDAGMDHILKSWLVLDNHDTPRLPNLVPDDEKAQRMARILQFVLPGAVCLYYGSELGMKGGEDPEQRAPMRWELVNDTNQVLALHRKLISLRKSEPALRYGDFRRLNSESLFAFLRKTTSARETVIVLANPSRKKITDLVQIRDSKMQDVTPLKDVFTGKTFTVFSGLLEVELEPQEIVVLKAETGDYPHGYNRYDRIN